MKRAATGISLDHSATLTKDSPLSAPEEEQIMAFFQRNESPASAASAMGFIYAAGPTQFVAEIGDGSILCEPP